MDDQPFTYYQPAPNFNSYSDLQYPQSSYDAEYARSDDNPFVDPNFVNAQPQNSAPSWPDPFTTPDASGVAFQRRGAVSGAVPEQPGPEAGSETAPRGLRIDTSGGGNNGEQLRGQETAGNLASPLNIRPQHLDSATTPTFPPNTYDTTTAPTTYDMNHNHDRSTLPLSLTMPPTPTYFMGHQAPYDNRQLSQPQSALPGHPNQHHQIPQDQYAPSRSPQLHVHPLSAPPYGTSTPQGVMTIPYTPSSIASSSVRSVSPASTAATSAQPLDFSTYASPVGDYDMSSVPTHSPVAHQPGPLSAGASHSLSPVIRSSIGAVRSAASHSASPVRRRANKQRLDDARRKEICTYARDRPKARQEDIALRYGVERSTISKILKNKDKWLSLDTHSSRKSIPTKHSSPVCIRPSKFPEIETELLKWVKECQENGTNITDTRIKTKAKECAAEIGLPEGKFKASSGWIENFKIRNNLTRRSQDDREVSPLNEGPEHMDEDEDAPIPASQSTQIEDGDGYEADANGQDSFNSLLSVSTEPDVGMLPHDTSYSTFSDSMVSSQDLSLLSNTPLSSTASSFASSPSGGLPHRMANPNLRARGHSNSVAMRAVGPSCTPSGSPQSGASPIQPLSPARLDMRFASTPTSASIPRFPSPLSASTSASGNPLVMIQNARHSPVSQKHSRNPSDASGFSYDVPSTDFPNGFGPPLFEPPSPHQTLEALDTVLKYFQQPQTAGIASQLDCSTFAAVRTRLAERLAQSLHPQRADVGALNSDA